MLSIMKTRICFCSLTPTKFIMPKLYMHLLKPQVNVDYCSTKYLSIDEWDKAACSYIKTSKFFTIDSIMKSCYEKRNKSLAKSFVEYIESSNAILLPITMACYLKILTIDPIDYSLFLDLSQKIWDGPYHSTESMVILKKEEGRYPHESCYTNTRATYMLDREVAKKGLVHYLNMMNGNNMKDICGRGFWEICMKHLNAEKELSIRKLIFKKMLKLRIAENHPVDAVTVKSILKFLQYNLLEFKHSNILNNQPCQHCNTKLKNDCITKEDIARLKDEFERDVVMRRGIYIPTSQREWTTFKTFLKATSPYNFVLDGLNLGNNLQDLQRVKLFGRRCLIIGRKDQTGAIVALRNAIGGKVFTFNTDRESTDDIFMIYAALYSGFGTKIISRDHFCVHRHSLVTDRSKTLFDVWQRHHQIDVTNELQDWSIYDNKPQYDARTETFHVPYVSMKSPTIRTNRQWLCFNMKDTPDMEEIHR